MRAMARSAELDESTAPSPTSEPDGDEAAANMELSPTEPTSETDLTTRPSRVCYKTLKKSGPHSRHWSAGRDREPHARDGADPNPPAGIGQFFISPPHASEALCAVTRTGSCSAWPMPRSPTRRRTRLNHPKYPSVTPFIRTPSQ